MLASVTAAQTTGLTPQLIRVEADVGRGFNSFSIIGLPDRVIEEAKDRLNTAIKNSGFTPPQKGGRKIVVSLAPANVKKEGPIFDCAIALSYLKAAGEIRFNEKGRVFLGELGLNGELYPVSGVLLIAQHLKEEGIHELFVPQGNAREAALIKGLTVYGAENLSEVAAHLNTREDDELPQTKLSPQSHTRLAQKEREAAVDMNDIRGQDTAKRGLLIAAAGRHNIALVGPPGSGKTLLARAFTNILPDLSMREALETTGIHSVAGRLGERGIVTTPPFVAPHHTASYVSLIGGGQNPRPGEITLAHKGVLFLDEFPEFDRRVIESLRQPLEEGRIRVSRARDTFEYPARIILLAAMNLCPCGNTGTSNKTCVCTPGALARYERKVSGPIMDRIDLWLSVPEVPLEKLTRKISTDTQASPAYRDTVQKARDIQHKALSSRKQKEQTNADVSAQEIPRAFTISDEAEKTLTESARSLGLSARGYHKTIKVAATIANLDGEMRIEAPHILEALGYRPRSLGDSY